MDPPFRYLFVQSEKARRSHSFFSRQNLEMSLFSSRMYYSFELLPRFTHQARMREKTAYEPPAGHSAHTGSKEETCQRKRR
jgi:hypothetical protein